MSNTVVPADREKGARLITQWLDETITNWDFEDEWPETSEDRGVVDIGRMMWLFYRDFPAEPLKTSNWPPERVLTLKRYLAFLRSGEPYEPVPYEEVFPWKPHLFTRLFGVKERPWETMGLKIDPVREKWWPFADETQYRRVTKFE